MKSRPEEVQEAVKLLQEYSIDYSISIETCDEIHEMGYDCEGEKAYFLRLVLLKEEEVKG